MSRTYDLSHAGRRQTVQTNGRISHFVDALRHRNRGTDAVRWSAVSASSVYAKMT
jgi:hypothetical protein